MGSGKQLAATVLGAVMVTASACDSKSKSSVAATTEAATTADDGTSATTSTTSGTDAATVTSASTSAGSTSSSSTSSSDDSAGDGTTGGPTSEWYCDPFFESHSGDGCGTIATCLLYDREGDADAYFDTDCIDPTEELAAVGEPCSMPQGPLAAVPVCVYGAVCAGASLEATQGVCIRLCDALNHPCPTGECVPCSTGVTYHSNSPIGVCPDEVGCPDAFPGCEVAGCWR